MTNQQKLQQQIAKGHRAKEALAEFIEPAFQVVRDTFYDRIAEITAKEPWATDKIVALMTAVRVCQEVQGQVQSIVTDADVARKELIRVEKIEKINPAKRRILGI